MNLMYTICGYGVCLFMGLLCVTILWKIWTNQINLSSLLAEANGSASMSRFQLLIFTLVIAISLFILVEKGVNPAGFPVIPPGILTLLGISAGTYAVGKGISFSRDEGVTTPEERMSLRQTAKEISATGANTDVTPAEAKSSGAENPAPPVAGI